MKLSRALTETLGVFRPSFMRSLMSGDPADVLRWVRKGRPAPPPPSIKLRVLRCYREAFLPPIFIETGTYRGDTVYALRDEFLKLFTIELSHELFTQAARRLKDASNITALEGNSGTVLETMLKDISRPCLFWLDGHYSGGITARGVSDCPLREELEHILRHPVKQHVILMDDARLFGRLRDYPTVEELVQRGSSAGYDSELHYDMLCLTPDGAPKMAERLKRCIG